MAEGMRWSADKQTPWRVDSTITPGLWDNETLPIVKLFGLINVIGNNPAVIVDIRQRHKAQP